MVVVVVVDMEIKVATEVIPSVVEIWAAVEAEVVVEEDTRKDMMTSLSHMVSISTNHYIARAIHYSILSLFTILEFKQFASSYSAKFR